MSTTIYERGAFRAVSVALGKGVGRELQLSLSGTTHMLTPAEAREFSAALRRWVLDEFPDCLSVHDVIGRARGLRMMNARRVAQLAEDLEELVDGLEVTLLDDPGQELLRCAFYNASRAAMWFDAYARRCGARLLDELPIPFTVTDAGRELLKRDQLERAALDPEIPT